MTRTTTLIYAKKKWVVILTVKMEKLETQEKWWVL